VQQEIVLHAGDMIENRVTGERIIFRETSAENGGSRVLFETIVEPHGFVAAAHVHPFQEERFKVLEGRIGMRLGRRQIELSAGESVTVSPGTPHRFWNTGADRARFRSQIAPALHFESLLVTMFALANEGRTNRRGMPNPFQLAVVASASFDTVRLPFPPAPLQRLALAFGAPLGRVLGYRPVFFSAPVLVPKETT
jgi:mannose-6-phosphate isomerase-like protein (cupin superfamily)